MVRWIAILLMLITVAALSFMAGKQYASAPAAPSGMSAPAAEANPPAAAPESAPDPGLHWTVPAGWRTGEPRSMRYATYLAEGVE